MVADAEMNAKRVTRAGDDEDKTRRGGQCRLKSFRCRAGNSPPL